jgi:enolase
MIKEIIAKKILNSRKEPTISVTAKTDSGNVESSAPGGVSRGKHEAQPFSSRGIDFSINLVNDIGRQITGKKIEISSFEDLEKIEGIARQIDNSADYKLLGANSLFALESALLKAAALEQKKELWQFLNEKAKIMPRLMGNCIGGGRHIRQKKRLDFQEFLFIPKTKRLFDGQFINLNAYKKAKKMLQLNDKGWNGALTDENAYASALSNEQILELVLNFKKQVEKQFEIKLDLGIDVAASTLWNGINYSYKNPETKREREGQIEYIADLIKKYNLFYVEDPLHEDDFSGFARLLRMADCLICGDDLIATQLHRLEKAIKEKSINAVIIKPNQNGSLLQAKQVADLAKKSGITCIMSHRSGETMDTTIADLAFAWQIPFIKAGITGPERLAKINRLIKIEKGLG